MKKTSITRRDFLKGSMAGLASAAAMGILGGCNAEAGTTTEAGTTAAESLKETAAPETTKTAGTYIPGTYSATAQGIGTIKVTMTFDAEKITDVVIDASAETPSIGKPAAEELTSAILAAQDSEVDVIGGATLTSNAVKKAAQKCIQQAKGEIPVEIITDKKDEEGPADWLGVAPEIEEASIKETWETDILIVGAGNAGCCAAAYAASNGLKFRMIEKMGTFGKVRGWYGAVDSEDILAAGEPKIDRGALRRELQRYSSGKCNLKTFNTWIEESADMHTFVKSIYAKLAPEAKLNVTVGEESHWPNPETSGFFFPAIEHTWSGGNRNQLFTQYVADAGYAIDYNTALVKLEKDGDRVTGVIAQKTETGEYIRINASKGVLLATGGYPGNPAMMEALDPLAVSVITTNVCNPQNTGEGIKAGLWVGAAMQKEAAPMIFDRGAVAPGVDAGYKVLENGDKVFPGENGQFGVGSQPFLKVNRRGERFTNESGTYDHMSYAASNQPGGVYAQIFDANMGEDAKRFHTIGCSAGLRTRGPKGYMGIYEKQLMPKGEAFMADTLEELADKLGFDAEAKATFLATCARYNDLYDKQDDVDFGKPAYRLSALRQPPFYGYWLGGCLLTTEQGILVNEKSQAVNEQAEPIEGLYVCGDASGGFFVDNYPCLMPGVACGKAMTFAIKAIKEMM